MLFVCVNLLFLLIPLIQLNLCHSIDVSLVEDDNEDVAVDADVAAVVAKDDIREGSDGVRDVLDDVATDDCARVDDGLPAADDGNDVSLILLC